MSDIAVYTKKVEPIDGGSAPDKRTRIDPVPAKIPLRPGGTVLF